MDTSPDVSAALLAAIDARSAEQDAPTAGDDRARLRARLRALRLEADRVEAELHGDVTHQPVTYGEAAFCAECGEPVPCPSVRALLDRYDADPGAGGGPARDPAPGQGG